jgi:excisionase family DNA binding protein
MAPEASQAVASAKAWRGPLRGLLSRRLELTLAPQGPLADFHSEAQRGTAKHPVDIPKVSRSGRTHGDPPDAYRTTPFGAPVARPSERVFLTPAEVATRLKVSRATVYALIERGDLVARHVGLGLRIAVGELEAFLDRR